LSGVGDETSPTCLLFAIGECPFCIRKKFNDEHIAAWSAWRVRGEQGTEEETIPTRVLLEKQKEIEQTPNKTEEYGRSS
jgi:hypothetical protein